MEGIPGGVADGHLGADQDGLTRVVDVERRAMVVEIQLEGWSGKEGMRST
jgi:hypothetical protein